MRSRVWMVAATAVISIGTSAELAAAPTPQRSPLMTQRQLTRRGFQRVWYVQAPLPFGETVERAAFRGRRLYVGTSSGKLVAVDADNGKLLWVCDTGMDARYWFPPAVAEKAVMMLHGNTLLRIDPETGKAEWRWKLDFVANTAPIVDPDAKHVVVGGSDGKTYSLRVDDIRRWVEWSYMTGGEINGSPVRVADYVLFGSVDRKLYACGHREGYVNWSYRTDAPITAGAAGLGSNVVVPSTDFGLYCLDAIRGKRIWKLQCAEALNDTPTIICTDIYQRCVGNGLYRIDGVTGKAAWHRKDLDRFVSASRDRIYALDLQRRLVVVDRETGRDLAMHDFTQRFDHVVQNEESEDIFLVTRKGLAMAVRNIKSPYPLYWPANDAKKKVEELTLPVFLEREKLRRKQVAYKQTLDTRFSQMEYALRRPIVHADVNMLLKAWPEFNDALGDKSPPEDKFKQEDLTIRVLALWLNSIPEVRRVMDNHGLSAQWFLEKRMPVEMATVVLSMGGLEPLEKKYPEMVDNLRREKDKLDMGDPDAVQAVEQLDKQVLDVEWLIKVGKAIPRSTYRAIKPRVEELKKVIGGGEE